MFVFYYVVLFYIIPYLFSFSYRVVRLIFSSLAVLARLLPVRSSIWSSSCRSLSFPVSTTFSSSFNVGSKFRSVAVIYPPPASSMARRTQFLSSRILPGQPYCSMVATASRSNPCTANRYSLEKRFRKNFANGRMSS